MQPIQFFAARAEDGALLPGATVDVFVQGTQGRAPLFADSPCTVPLGNPVSADANARVFFYTTTPRIDMRISRYGYVAPLIVDISTWDAATAVEWVQAEIDAALGEIGGSLAEMEDEFVASQIDKEQRFRQFLLSSGYQLIGDYGPGLLITELNQIFAKNGELYRAGAALVLPYITTGVWADESAKFVSVGDAALRQELARPEGSTKVGFLQSGAGAAPRSMQDKMRDTVSVKDFGAIEGGSFDCTQAFLKAGKGAFVPPGVYLVNSSQVSIHAYHGPGVVLANGQLIQLEPPLLDGAMVQRVGGTPLFGFSASPPDQELYLGAGNATQGIAWVLHDGIEKLFITQRVSGASWGTNELVRISEWRWIGDGADMTVVAFTEPLALGHGADLSALVENGEIYLFTTVSNDGAVGGGASLGGKGYSKIKWRGDATVQSDVQRFEVFGDPGDGSRLFWPQRASVCVTNDGKFVILVATSNVGTGRFFFLYDRAAVEAAGTDARSVAPLSGPVPFERAPGEFGSTLQGMTSDGVHLYTVWGAGAPRAARTIQVYDLSGCLRRTIPYVGPAALYSEEQLMGLTAKGIPVSFEPEGICLRNDELLQLSVDAWKTPQDIVTYEGFNWACINTNAMAGIPPTTRANWVITKRGASGGYNPTTPYIAGSYLRRDKRIMRIKLAAGDAGELKLQAAVTDPSTGTMKEYYSGTDIAYNAENGSFTIAKFYEALGTYKKFMELNYGNTLNIFSTDAGEPNDRWVSIKSSWNAGMYGMQLRSSRGTAADGGNIDLHAFDCPAAPGESVISSLDSAVIRFRNGNVTAGVLSAAGLIYYGGQYIRATTDNAVSLGRSINRFSVVYAGTGSINTSDATEKTPISEFSQAHINVGLRLLDEIGTYQWLQEIEKKGPAGARIHFGTTVQRAIEIFEDEGLDPFRFGAVCLDEWEAHSEEMEPAELDTHGNIVREAVVQEIAAGRRYGFRDHQLQYLMLAATAWRQKKLEDRLRVLEQSAQG
ncbi:tail fiber domain-containing protein [Pseudomonas sp. NPDC096917]|uniref:tail fiber domain-containing protein n=1 Tax=Pseudomonas sp. NPDC096917 TaxID=3364483 RepID=UPI00383A3D5C